MAGPSSGQGGDGYEPIRPIESRSNSIGMIDQVPVVKYNEYSGSVSIDLTVGVEGLSIPIHYSNQERSLRDSFALPFDEVMGARFGGAGWYVGYGVLSPSGHEPTHHQVYETDRPTEYDRVLLREPNGAENEFKVDLYFQQVPAKDDWYNFHFLDSSFRRLERKIDEKNEQIATDEFTMLSPDGSRTTFRSASMSPGGQGFFYPTVIERANGRKLTLSYCDGGGLFPSAGTAPDYCAGVATPILESVSDDWGRTLRLRYAVFPPTGHTVLDRVELEAPGHPDQELASFVYQVGTYGSIPVTELRAQETPLGHRTEFHYQRHFTTDEQQINLSQVVLPTGGTVDLQYDRYRQFVCPHTWTTTGASIDIDPTLRTRVSRLSYGGESYEYDYKQGVEYSPSHDRSWVVTMKSTQSAVPFERLTQYYQAPANLVGQPDIQGNVECTATPFPHAYERLAGQPALRLEVYGGPASGAFRTDGGGGFELNAGGSHRREEWSYARHILAASDNPSPDPTSEILVRAILPTRYSVRRDWRTTHTEFEYVADGTTLAAPFFTRPRQITSWREDRPGDVLMQTFSYESRFRGDHHRLTTIANDPHFLSLPATASQAISVGGVDSPVASESYVYEPPPSRHPLLRERRYQFSPTDSEITRFTYYPAGDPLHGMLETETKVGDNPYADQNTEFEEYDFGKASLIQPPMGPAIERLVRPDGNLRSETKDGVTTTFGYDLDRRLERSEVPGSGQLAREIDYSEPLATSPLATPTKTELMGGRELMVEVSDAWGRVIEKRTRIDASTVGVTSTEYDPLGLVASETNAGGAVRSYTYDVYGRQRSITTVRPEGGLLERIDIQYNCPYGGLMRKVETLWKIDPQTHLVDPSTWTQRETENDVFGRMVRAVTHKMSSGYPNVMSHWTNFDYAFVEGLQRTLIRPKANEPRLEEKDWFGRTTLECHPEMYCQVNVAAFTPQASSLPPVLHSYDPLGRLRHTTHPDGTSTVYYYDHLDRLTARTELSTAGDDIDGIQNTYSPTNNKLLTSASIAGGLSVRQEQSEFDALQRPLATSIEIPPAQPAPYELTPTKYWLFGETLTLAWTETTTVAEYEVVLERLVGGAPSRPLILSTMAEELVLDESLIQQAVAAMADPSAGQPFLDDLGADPDFLLDPEVTYRWRVYGWRGNVPTLASPWQVLDEPIGPDDCHFDNFRVRDGVNEGALVEWRTSNCPEGGPFSVAILTSTLDAPAGCEYEDAVFAGDKNGPRRALFMITGYDMVDDAPEFPVDLNQPACPGPEQASFRGVIRGPEGEEVHSVGPLTGRVLEGDICDVRNVNIIDGLNGTAPIVRWETSDCEGHTVQVLAEAEVDPDLPSASLCRDPGELATGATGQISADFMIDGYTSSSGQQCPPVERAWFRVRITDNQTGDQLETTPLLGYVEPEGGFPAGCYTRLFTESSAPGIVPIVAWEARNCEGYEVEVTRTAVGQPSDLNCLVRNDLWQTEQFGVRDARFMIDGYPGIGGAHCDPLADMHATGNDRVEFDFSINLLDPATGYFVEPQTAIKKTLRATYTLPPAGVSSGPCKIDFFGATNGFFGYLPLATWGTSGTCSAVQLEVRTRPYLEPASCRLNGEVWSRQPDGPVALTFMVAGYDHGFVNDYDGQHDCVGEVGANGTHGEALTVAYVTLEATAADGTEIRSPEVLVRNHNDQSQSGLPGPDDPCEILDFGVDQPALPGQQATDTLPTIRWRTTCPASSRYSVRVYVDAESTNFDPRCRLHGLLFGSSKNGPQPAIFMRSGWWNWIDGSELCYANQASFRMEIVEDSTGELLSGQTAGPIAVTYSGDFEGEPPIGSCAGDSCSAPSCSHPYPTFEGLTTDPQAGADCQTTLHWQAGTSHCEGDLTYNVYRSSTPYIVPDPDYIFAEGIAGTSFTDHDIVSGGSYYYMVVAKDSVSGLESAPTHIRRLSNQCTQGQHAFWAQPDVVQAGQSTTLHWDFPEATFLYLVGFGEQSPQGQIEVAPSATTMYQMHVSFGSGQGAFTTEVQVEGGNSPPPVRLGECHRPCGETAIIGGHEHYCRGFGFWDDEYQIDRPPLWMTVADWPDLVENALGDPISPYCLKAVCGGGSIPPNRWHVPGELAASWWPDPEPGDLVEYPNDGLDNDCDGEIDEPGP